MKSFRTWKSLSRKKEIRWVSRVFEWHKQIGVHPQIRNFAKIMKLQKGRNTNEKISVVVTHMYSLVLERRDDFRSVWLGKQKSRSQEFENEDQKRLGLGIFSFESNQNIKKICIEEKKIVLNDWYYSIWEKWKENLRQKEDQRIWLNDERNSDAYLSVLEGQRSTNARCVSWDCRGTLKKSSKKRWEQSDAVLQ